jgi:two-component sensor histidine kinase
MDKINKRIHELERELKILKSQAFYKTDTPLSVIVPEPIQPMFLDVERKVADHFNEIQRDPESGEITIDGERYVLLRSASLSYDFIDFIKERYSDKPPKEAIEIGNNFLYDNAKVFGKRDAIAFHRKLKLNDPIQKLSAGPVHFAFTGWANVEILPESNPVANSDYFLKYIHHNSFEAQSWIKAKKSAERPVCIMNSGYSAGWCEESFGISLTTVEIECEAHGAEHCTFIMAPTYRIEEYLGESIDSEGKKNYEIPIFFKRKAIEEELRKSVKQKELLLKEIHHRVKNNLQIIVSLLRLQISKTKSEKFRKDLETSMNRVSTMAAVHELMYKGENLDSLSIKSYFENLIDALFNLYNVSNKVEKKINIDISDMDFSLERSIPLGLILNEITCNSFKHALSEGGEFILELSQEGDNFILIIGDNGPGLKPDQNDEGLGLSLIEILCDQIDAQLEIQNKPDGLLYKITFQVA